MKFLVTYRFGQKESGPKNMFGSNNLLVQENVGFMKNMRPKQMQVQNIVWSKKCLVQENVKSKKYWGKFFPNNLDSSKT